MQEQIMRKLFLGFIHILHHAKKEPIYGSWIIEELGKQGYEILVKGSKIIILSRCI